MLFKVAEFSSSREKGADVASLLRLRFLIRRMLIVIGAIGFSSGVGSAGEVEQAIASAEATLRARVGVAILDTENGRRWEHRAGERFPMASTFKLLACAALLKSGPTLMNQRVLIRKGDIISHAPVTKAMVGQEVSAADLCAITLRTSDNTAANKIVALLGGPPAITAFLRGIGDHDTRLDRVEPALNESRPGDPRDTTTPSAMLATLETLALGSALGLAGRSQLLAWLDANETGSPLLRAGLPKDWKIGDRTGSGGFGTRGIVAILRPPGHRPILAVIYMTGTAARLPLRNAAIARIGTALAHEIAR